MPAQPLIDLDEIDLGRVVATRDDVYAVLRQRDAFALLDGILHRDPERGSIVGYKDVRADDWWAAGHIPGRPIFPGALMIEAGAQLCSYDYLLRSEGEERFIGFGGLESTRFRGVVEPPVRMLFAARPNRIRSTMFTYFAQGFAGGKLVFETEVIGVAL